MNIKVFQIDFTAADFDANDVYSEISSLIESRYLVKVEEDGDILSPQEMRAVSPPATGAFLKRYETRGTKLETLVACAELPSPNNWQLTEHLPCVLSKENAAKLESLMRSNRWEHYFCLAQTQMLVGTTGSALVEALLNSKYHGSIELE